MSFDMTIDEIHLDLNELYYEDELTIPESKLLELAGSDSILTTEELANASSGEWSGTTNRLLSVTDAWQILLTSQIERLAPEYKEELVDLFLQYGYGLGISEIRACLTDIKRTQVHRDNENDFYCSMVSLVNLYQAWHDVSEWKPSHQQHQLQETIQTARNAIISGALRVKWEVVHKNVAGNILHLSGFKPNFTTKGPALGWLYLEDGPFVPLNLIHECQHAAQWDLETHYRANQRRVDAEEEAYTLSNVYFYEYTDTALTEAYQLFNKGIGEKQRALIGEIDKKLGDNSRKRMEQLSRGGSLRDDMSVIYEVVNLQINRLTALDPNTIAWDIAKAEKSGVDTKALEAKLRLAILQVENFMVVYPILEQIVGKLEAMFKKAATLSENQRRNYVVVQLRGLKTIQQEIFNRLEEKDKTPITRAQLDFILSVYDVFILAAQGQVDQAITAYSGGWGQKLQNEMCFL